MTSHTYHPDTHEHGLADECPRCAEHARHPFESLDDTNLRQLIRRVREGQRPRSGAEATAMEEVEAVFRRSQVIAHLDRAQPVEITPESRRAS